MDWQAAFPIDTQNFQERLKILLQLQDEYLTHGLKINNLEIVTWPSRDFRTDDQGKYFRDSMKQIRALAEDVILKGINVYYIYHMTEDSKVLQNNWPYFLMVIEELARIRDALQISQARINFHHQGVVWHKAHPAWRKIEEQGEFQRPLSQLTPPGALRVIKARQEIIEHYVFIQRRAKEDIEEMIEIAGKKEIELNLEVTSLIDFYPREEKWEFLYFLPEQMMFLLEEFPKLKATLDISHLCFGMVRGIKNALTFPQKVIVDSLGQPPYFYPDFAFTSTFQLLERNVHQIHISGCSGMELGDEGIPVGIPNDLVHWPRIIQNIKSHCPEAILVPEIGDSHIDGEQIAAEVIKTYDFLCSLINI